MWGTTHVTLQPYHSIINNNNNNTQDATYGAIIYGTSLMLEFHFWSSERKTFSASNC